MAEQEPMMVDHAALGRRLSEFGDRDLSDLTMGDLKEMIRRLALDEVRRLLVNPAGEESSK